MSKVSKHWGLYLGSFVASALLFLFVAGPSLSATSRLFSSDPYNPECNTCANDHPGEPACPAESPKQGAKTGKPVVYGSGRNAFSVTELASAGFSRWSHGRSFVSDPLFGDGLAGPGWRVSGLLQLSLRGTYVVIVSGGAVTRAFQQSGGIYTPTMFYHDPLTVDSVNHTLVYSDSSSGTQWTFADFSAFWTAGRQGKVLKFSDAAGNLTTTVYSTTAGPTFEKILEVQQLDAAAPTNLVRFSYTYNLSGVAAGLIASVAQTKSVGGLLTTIRKVDYSYYGTSGANGPAGVLQWARITDGVNALETHYYRYNSFDVQGRLPLRYVLAPTGYERAKAALGSDAAIDAASDTVLAQWAGYYFEYDSNLKVTKEIVQGKGCGCGTSGGRGTYTYAYVPETHGQPSGPNAWNMKSIETLPDGNQNIIFTSGFGATMLEVFKDVTSGLQWITYYKYDSLGRLLEISRPSAMLGYDELNPALVTGAHISDAAGRIDIREYYSITDLPNGAVAGYLKQELVKNGELGVPVPLRLVQYTSRVGTTGAIFPVSKQTIYRNTDGTGALVTNYSFSWQGSTNQILQATMTFPVIGTSQNGSAAATSKTDQFDAFGRLTWSRNEDGFIKALEYDPLSSALTKQIVDVNTATSTNEPSGWTTPAGGGLHLTTVYRVDSLGRPTKVTSPGGKISFMVYLDTQKQVRSYPGWTGVATTGPTTVLRLDTAGSYRESLTMSAVPAVAAGEPTGAEAISSLEGLQREHFDTGDRLINLDSYFNLAGVPYATTPTLGTAGVNFYRRSYNYDAFGLLDRDVDWTGTVRRSFHDSLGRPKSEWIGTDDSPTTGDWSPSNTTGTNLIKVSENEYDANGVGDGLVTRARMFTSATASVDVRYQYDFRGRQTNHRGPDKVAVRRTYDNLGQVTIQETYADANQDFVIGASELREKLQAQIDDRGRLYQSIVHQVDPVSGVLGNRLTTNRWYNGRGNLLKTRSPNGLFSKSTYDGAGRLVARFTCYHDAETLFADADDVVGDTVIDEAVSSFDADGNVIQSTRYQRTSTASVTGDLASGWSEINSRRSYAAAWFDLAGRPTSVVDYGRNGGAALVRPATPPAPNTSDAYMVSLMEYNSAGNRYKVTDNQGKIVRRTFDLMGRSTAVVQNWIDGAVVETETDTDRTLEMLYDASGRLSQIKTRNPKGVGAGIEDQPTTYVYGTDANQATPPIWRNDMLVAEIYADSDDVYTPGGAPGAKLGNGVDAVFDRSEFTYDYAGRTKTYTRQLGTKRTYNYDSSGRLSTDVATTLGSGIDGAVRRIEQTYDDLSRLATTSSFSATSAGTLLNQVKFTYDGWGHEVKCEQGHEGAATGAPAYQKTFVDDPVSGEAKYSRLKQITYPNGRQEFRTYAALASVSDRLSRIGSISADSAGATNFETNTYLGTASLMKSARPQVTGGLNLDYGVGTGNPAGWDDFGRIDDQTWKSDAAVVRDGYQYGYDRGSNRTFRDNVTASARDELFVVDGLGRLASQKRGDLNAGRTDITGTPTFQEDFTLESLGNWRNLVQKTAGAVTLNQTRTHTKANEVGAITASVGTNWGDGAVDRNGSMTRVPKPGTLNQRWRLTYDAWFRLVRVVDDVAPNATVAEYKYDGMHRRIVKLKPNALNWDRRDYYYSCEWQIVEERELLNDVSKTTVATLPKYQWMWGLKYVDEVILRDENLNGDNDCAGVADRRIYYAQDAQFNVTALLDSSGNVVERVQYDSYGKHSLWQANWTTSQAASVYSNEVLFSGYRLDPESGLYSVRHRHYHPSLGRWVQRDPVGYAGGANLYAYVGSAPMQSSDPSGLKHLVKGPQAMIISYIAQFEVTDALINELQEAYGERFGGTNANVGKLVNELATSANPPPQFGPAGFDDFLKGYEYRSYMYLKPQICCNNKSSLKSGSGKLLEEKKHPGYTPTMKLADRRPGDWFGLPGLDGYVGGESGETPPPKWTETAFCAQVVWRNKSRIGVAGQVPMQILVKDAGVPYIHEEITYELCCDGTYTIKFEGSHFPSHKAYVDRVEVGIHHQEELGKFMFAGEKKDVRGVVFKTYTGTNAEIIPLD